MERWREPREKAGDCNRELELESNWNQSICKNKSNHQQNGKQCEPKIFALVPISYRWKRIFKLGNTRIPCHCSPGTWIDERDSVCLLWKFMLPSHCAPDCRTFFNRLYNFHTLKVNHNNVTKQSLITNN